MSYNALFRKAGRVLRSYIDSISSGDDIKAEKNKKIYEEYFRQRAGENQQQKRSAEGTGRNTNENRQRADTKAKDEKYYYNILGISGSATPQDIKLAYKKQIGLYHPDKVAALGPELQNLAQKKTQELNEAYQFFKKKYTF